MIATKRLFSKVNLPPATTQFILFVLFFLSGVAALIYQVMWQRMLFTAFGVDLTSITIVVSVFMFGLGLGGLSGGYAADRLAANLLGLYIIIEFGIALFGFFSPSLIEILSNNYFSNSAWMTMMLSFIVLAIPTMLMGATFPILVAHVNTTTQNIGRSVGSLYFANTLGGAFGAYFSGFILLYSLEMPDAINRAAMLNLIIASVAFMIFRRAK